MVINEENAQNNVSNSFPQNLLTQSDAEKLRYFKGCVIPHEHLINAVDDIMRVLNSQITERIILVCGPSGVGKSELISALQKRILKLSETTLLMNPGCHPVVAVEAVAPEEGSFKFHNLWHSALVSLQEPMLDKKISYKDVVMQTPLGNAVPFSKIQKGDYFEILQQALKHRETKGFIINEAHHMLRVTAGKKETWTVDLLKSLTNGSQTPIIPIGTYELLKYVDGLRPNIDDQIIQRTDIVEFRRYHENDEQDIASFGKTLKKLLRCMPFEESAEYLCDKNPWGYFYMYSLGCIGTLKIWLTKAYTLALECKAPTLDIKHLEKTKMSAKGCATLLKTAKDGEEKMKGINMNEDIKNLFHFSEAKLITRKKPQKKNTNKQKPFNRKPGRDSNTIK